jgi:hypothetical protein
VCNDRVVVVGAETVLLFLGPGHCAFTTVMGMIADEFHKDLEFRLFPTA